MQRTDPVPVDGVLDLPRNTDFRVKCESTKRLLHVLPKLLLSGQEFFTLPSRAKAELKVSSKVLSDLGIEVNPEKGVKVRRPVPNRRYLIGGTKALRYGWLVEIPDDLALVDLTFEWSVEMPGEDQPLRATHEVMVSLVHTGGKIFSMDSACWHRVFKFPEGRAPFSFTPHAILATMGQAKDRIAELAIEQLSDNHLKMSESVSIPGITADDLWSLHAFDPVKRGPSPIKDEIKALNEGHFSNGSIAMPVDVLVRAVSLAKRVDFGPDSIFGIDPGSLEHHPALEVLCGWWNHNAPAAEARRAKAAAVFVRTEIKPEYEASTGEPPESYDHFKRTKESNATVEYTVLVAFSTGDAGLRLTEHGWTSELVGGGEALCTKSAQERLVNDRPDVAKASLVNLSLFPRRHPSLWKSLQRKSKEMNRK